MIRPFILILISSVILSFVLGLRIGTVYSTEENAYLRYEPLEPEDDWNLSGHLRECARVIPRPEICVQTLRAAAKKIGNPRPAYEDK